MGGTEGCRNFFLLMMGCEEYDEDGDDFGRSRKFQTVLWVDFEDAKMNSHHELYRQRSHIERAPYLQHELVRGSAYCNPASAQVLSLAECNPCLDEYS